MDMRFIIPLLLIFICRNGCSMFLRVETGHQNIAIQGRDVYYGHFTKIFFHNLTCINAINIHCLHELTGAEEIDLLYSECDRGHWRVAHYTNEKHHFRLKQPIHARRLLISSRQELSVIDAQVESCKLEPAKITCHHHHHSRGHRHGKFSRPVIKAMDPNMVAQFEMRRSRLKRSVNEDTLSQGEHNFTSNLIVEEESRLVIYPGAILRFNADTGLIVKGELVAEGLSHNQIMFDALDSNKKWRGIEFNSTKSSKLSNSVIRNSITAVKVSNDSRSPVMDHLIIENNLQGIQSHASDDGRLFKIATINNQKSGIEYLGKGSITIEECISSSNGQHGIDTNSILSTVIIRNSKIISNKENGIVLTSSDAIIDTCVINSNGISAIRSNTFREIHINSVNISAHSGGIAILSNGAFSKSRLAITSSHFHDNSHGVLQASSFSALDIRDSSFRRNKGPVLLIGNCYMIELKDLVFDANIFQSYNAGIRIESDLIDYNCKISDSRFVRNTMATVVEILKTPISQKNPMGSVAVEKCEFLANRADSILSTNIKNARVEGSTFANVAAKCEISIKEPMETIDLINNNFNETSENKKLCQQQHQYKFSEIKLDNVSEEQPTHDDDSETYLPNPFKQGASVIPASQKIYEVHEDVIVPSGQSLLIEAGSIFEFNSGVALIIRGNVVFSGSPDAPIVIRGRHNTVWRGIIVEPNHGCLNMSHTVLEDPSIGIWIDSECVHLDHVHVIHPRIHGVQIGSNSDRVVDLGDLLIENSLMTAISVDERRNDIFIRNATVHGGDGIGIDFVAPTGNVILEAIEINQSGSTGIRVVELSSSPLQSLVIYDTIVHNLHSGEAGLIVISGWVRNVTLDEMQFFNNSIPSTIIILECNDSIEKILHISNSTFSSNSDMVQHIDLENCANLKLISNNYTNNNLDGVGTSVVISSPIDAIPSDNKMSIIGNQFQNNRGIYTINVDSKSHHVEFIKNYLIDNINKGAVMLLNSANIEIDSNQFDNPNSKNQVMTTGDDINLLPTFNFNESALNASQFDALPIITPIGCNCSQHGLCDIFNQCICNNGWTGKNCEQPICNPKCSSEHGRCTSVNKCTCDNGWNGLDCTIPSCQDEMCHHGHCDAKNSQCRCDPGWIGDKCNIPECSNGCSLNGMCISPNTCHCFSGFIGRNCSEQLEPECDFDCDRGECDAITRTCRCERGWSGAACDVCLKDCEKPSIRLFYIEPSTARHNDINSVVGVYGEGFARDGTFKCMFGVDSMPAKRISSTLIRCSIPLNLTLGRHAFQLSFNDELIPSQSIHFTIYEPCQPNLCQGACIGPLCICPQGRTGVLCDVIEVKSTIDPSFIDHQKASHGFEGTPYIVMLPTLSSATMRVNSSIDDLTFIPSKGILAWTDPIGSETPYEIQVDVISPAGESKLDWNVTIDPQYDIDIDDTVIVNKDTAIIQGSVVGKTQDKSVPVLVQISRNGIIEEFVTFSEPNSRINFTYIAEFPGTYQAILSHPGKSSKPQKHATFSIKQLNMPINGDSTTTSLKVEVKGADWCSLLLLQPSGGEVRGGAEINADFSNEWTEEVLALVQCDNWDPEIVRAPPIETVFERNLVPKAFSIYEDSEIKKIYEIGINANLNIDGVEGIQVTDIQKEDGRTVVQFVPKDPGGAIQFSNQEKSDSIVVPIMLSGSSNDYQTFKICLRDEFDGQPISTGNVGTISLSNKQLGVEITRTNVRINIQWAEFTVKPGIYELTAFGDLHSTRTELLVLDPLNTTFCVQLNSMRFESVPTLECVEDVCQAKISRLASISSTTLPILNFEPSVTTKERQRVLVKLISNEPGLIGLWNSVIDGHEVTHSRRTVKSNESFWTTISLNDKHREGIQKINIPFVFLPQNSSVPIHTSSPILIQHNSLKPNNHNNLAIETNVFCDCGDGIRSKCAKKYMPIPASCGNSWSMISDDTVSIEILAAFIGMLIECREVAVDFSEVRNSLECVASIENECPISSDNRIKRQSNQNPVNIVNHLSSVNLHLGSVLPVLNVLDLQTIRISSAFIDFIDSFQAVLPTDAVDNSSPDSLDELLNSISDFSDNNNYIDQSELQSIQQQKLATIWNSTINHWRSGNMAKLPQNYTGITFEQARRLVNSADRLKSLTRHNMAANPFDFLQSYMARTLQTKSVETPSCAVARVHIDKEYIEEGENIIIRVYIENKSNHTLSHIGVQLDFKMEGNQNTSKISFEMGPSWISGIASINGLGSLDPQGSFQIRWTRRVKATGSIRLTTNVTCSPLIVLTFMSNAATSRQLLKSSNIVITPKKVAKAINIIRDDYSPTFISNAEFSLITVIVNSGYSTLQDVQVRLNDFTGLSSSPIVDSVFINGHLQKSRSVNQNLGTILSGASSIIRMVLQDRAPIYEANVTCITNGRLLPLESMETYAIRSTSPSDNGILLSLVNETKSPLFLFRPSTAQMHNVILLEFLTMEKFDETNDKITYLAAFRNKESSSFSGALWAQMPTPNVGERTKLLAIIDKSSPIRRQVQSVEWETEGEKPMLNWIDPGGSDIVTSPITYELQFIRPNSTDDEDGPLFDEPFYRFDASSASPKAQIGRIDADADGMIQYKLFAFDESFRGFGIDPITGEIYKEDDDEFQNDEYCMVVEAHDTFGHVSSVPIAINTGGARKNCVLFSTEGRKPLIHAQTIPTAEIFTIAPPAGQLSSTTPDPTVIIDHETTTLEPLITTTRALTSEPTTIYSTTGISSSTIEYITNEYTTSSQSTITSTSYLPSTTILSTKPSGDTSTSSPLFSSTLVHSSTPTTNEEETSSLTSIVPTTTTGDTSTSTMEVSTTNLIGSSIIPNNNNEHMNERSTTSETPFTTIQSVTTTEVITQSPLNPNIVLPNGGLWASTTHRIPDVIIPIITSTMDPIAYETTTTERIVELPTDSWDITSSLIPDEQSTHGTDETSPAIEESSTSFMTTVTTHMSSTQTESSVNIGGEEEIYKNLANNACTISSTNPIYKIICDISSLAKPIN